MYVVIGSYSDYDSFDQDIFGYHEDRTKCEEYIRYLERKQEEIRIDQKVLDQYTWGSAAFKRISKELDEKHKGFPVLFCYYNFNIEKVNKIKAPQA